MWRLYRIVAMTEKSRPRKVSDIKEKLPRCVYCGSETVHEGFSCPRIQSVEMHDGVNIVHFVSPGDWAMYQNADD